MFPLWPLFLFSFGLPFFILVWVLLNKRKNKIKTIDLKEIINKEKQISSLMRYK